MAEPTRGDGRLIPAAEGNASATGRALVPVGGSSSQRVLALSDESYRRRQERINQHHGRAIQVNSAAAYLLAMRFKQLDNGFQHIAGEMGELRDGIRGQQMQVGTLVDSVDGIQSEMEQQNSKIAELESEVRRHMDAADDRLRHYEELYERQAEELRSHEGRLRALIKSKVSQDFVVDVLLFAGAGALVRSPVVRLPVWLLTSLVSSLPLRGGPRAATLRTLGRVLAIARLLILHLLFQALRRKAVEFTVHSGVGGLRAYGRMARDMVGVQFSSLVGGVGGGGGDTGRAGRLQRWLPRGWVEAARQRVLPPPATPVVNTPATAAAAARRVAPTEAVVAGAAAAATTSTATTAAATTPTEAAATTPTEATAP